jgi:hypothetical protein
VIAVNDGKVLRIGTSKRLGRFHRRRTSTATRTLRAPQVVAKTYPSPKRRTKKQASSARSAPRPRAEAREGRRPRSARAPRHRASRRAKPRGRRHRRSRRSRLFAAPRRKERASPSAANCPGRERRAARSPRRRRRSGSTQGLRRQALRKGARVLGGTILGRIGKTSKTKAPHLLFEIRPAGGGAPRIDPKPILDGWKLLESTAVYRAKGKNALFGSDADAPSIGQIMLMSKEMLARRVLSDRGSSSTAAARATSAPAPSTGACSPRCSSSPRPA